MRPSLREDIITTATGLFNEQGYQNVSMRAIAAALGISVGNLTYHFPKKQDIFRSIMERNYHVTITREEVTTLVQFHTMLKKMLDSLEINAFYFRDPSVMPLNAQGERDVADLYTMTLDALESLQRKGLFRSDLSHAHWENTAKVLMLSHIGWIHPSQSFSAVQGMTATQFLRAHWSLLEPYFTPAGQAEFQATILPLF